MSSVGVIDFECLDNCSTFNLTGGIFNTSDFIKVGGLKPSIKIAFNYEFLLRATDKKLKVIVVPKEGYKHLIGRKGSLTSEYEKTISDKDVKKPENRFNEEVTLPNGRGKDVKIGVIADGELIVQAKEAGLDTVINKGDLEAFGKDRKSAKKVLAIPRKLC